MAEMRVILVDYGPVVIELTDTIEQSTAGAYYAAVGWMLAGGNTEHSLEYYVDKVQSFEGATVDGVVIEGPDFLVGIHLSDYPLETDTDILSADASALDFSDGPYERWYA
jgi:hypothetical protein